MFLLVPAHPGCPGQIPQSRKTVVCVCVCMLEVVMLAMMGHMVVMGMDLGMQMAPGSWNLQTG